MKLYHYTTAPRACLILQSGFIRTGKYAGAFADPYVWFSSNRRDEKTAMQMRYHAGEAEAFPIDAALYHRRMRFVWESAKAVPFADLNLNPTQRSFLVAQGQKMGGDPAEWFGLREDVPVGECRLEGQHGSWWREESAAAFLDGFAAVEVFEIGDKAGIRAR